MILPIMREQVTATQENRGVIESAWGWGIGLNQNLNKSS